MRFLFSGNDNYTEGVTPIAPLYGVFDDAANDSDKSYTVPGGETWQLLYANVVLVTTATAGNRQMRFQVYDSANRSQGYISAGAVQTASTTRSYGFLQGIYRETGFIDNMIQIPIPIDLYLPAGSIIRFYDSAAIAPAADDMTVSFGVHVYKGC
jgi:hypothetical protein